MTEKIKGAMGFEEIEDVELLLHLIPGAPKKI